MASIHQGYLDCVIAIGVENPDKSKPEPNWIATGFLVGKGFERLNDETKFRVFLVTNKHVFMNVGGRELKQIIIRFNPKGEGEIRSYRVDLYSNDKPIWTGHPNGEDVAVMYLPIGQYKKEGRIYDFFHAKDEFTDEDTFDIISTKDMAKRGVTEGDGVFVLGYPMELVDLERQYVIVRSGSIARIRDLLKDGKPEFLVDVFCFPGNSGGPVITRCETAHIEGTQAINDSFVIGIVKSYLPYEDTAYSRQTGEKRVVFQENSGLSVVLPSDYILQTIDEHINRVQIDEKGNFDIRY